MSGERTRAAVAAAVLLLAAWVTPVAAERTAASDEDAPWLTAGVVTPGVYRVRCSTMVTPPDAMALAGRPPREIEEGETGTLVRTTTEVAREDGRRLAVLSRQPLCTVRLQEPGNYVMTVHEHTLHWAWLRHPDDIGLIRRTLGDRESSTSWGVRVVRPGGGTGRDESACDGTDVRAGEESDEAEALRRAVASALSAQGARIGPEHVIIRRDGLLSFAVHLRAADRQPRHTLDCLVREVDEGNLELPLEPALHMIFGAVQHAAGETRVTMRVVEVETSIVGDAGMGQSSGTDERALTEAAHDAAADIDFDLLGW